MTKILKTLLFCISLFYIPNVYAEKVYVINFDHGVQSPNPATYTVGTGEILPTGVTGVCAAPDTANPFITSTGPQGGQAWKMGRGAGWDNEQGYRFDGGPGIGTAYVLIGWTMEFLINPDYTDTGSGLSLLSTLYKGKPVFGTAGAHSVSINQNTGILTWSNGFTYSLPFEDMYSDTILEAGTWYHVAVVARVTGDSATGQMMELWINGVKEDTTPFPVGWEHIYGIPTDFSVGSAYNYTGRNFQGQIDAFVIHDQALNAETFELVDKICPFIREADIDGDCFVGFSDLELFVQQWLQSGAYADFDQSGRVDFEDFAVFALSWLSQGELDAGGYAIYNLGDIITSGPWVDARVYGNGLNDATVSGALSAIGSDEATLFISPGVWDIASSLTIPKNVTLRFERGAIFNIQTGVTLSLRGGLEAGLHQIFSGTGNISFSFGSSTDTITEVYPQWWGAVTGDTTDVAVMTQNTSALKAALSSQKMFMPEGIYKINGDITGIYYGNITGAGAFRSVIKASDTSIDILKNVSGDCVFRDIGFTGGRYGAYLVTGNVDSTVIKFESCRFEGQSSACVADDSASNSTLLIIKDCEFITSTTGMALDISTDMMDIEDCWFSVFSPCAIRNKGGVMHIRGLCGVPINNTSNSCWIKNYGSLYVTDSRFGSEDAGRCVLENYATTHYAYPLIPSDVYIEKSAMYCGDNAIKFYDLPNNFVLRDNSGYLLSPGKGIYLDSNIPASSRQYFPMYGRFENGDQLPLFGSQELTQLVDTKGYTNLNYSTTPLISDLIYSGVSGNALWTDWYSNTPMSWATYPYNGIPCRKYQASGDSQYFAYWRTLSSTLFTNNTLYTATVDFVCDTDRPISLQVFFGDRQITGMVNSGLHVLSIPYFWSTGKSTEIKFSVGNLSAGDIVYTGRWRVFKNNYRQEAVETLLYGNTSDSVPASTNIDFATGDKIIHNDTAIGSYTGRICVGQGHPGTWKNYKGISP